MEQLGIEPVQLLTQVLNFVIMVVLLTKFLYKPVMQKLEERRKKIEEGLLYTEKMKKEMEELDKKRQEVIDKAKEEAKRIIEEGKKSAKSVEKAIIEKAHQEAAAILEKGEAELKLSRRQMESSIKVQTVDIAQNIVKKLLEDILTTSDQQKIIDKKIKEIARLIK